MKTKKLLIFFLTIFLLLASSCTPKATVYTVTRPNLYGVEKVFVVDTINETIDDGTDIYHYTLSPYSSGYSVTIEYPNGATYSWQQSDSGSGSGGWSHDYNPYRYVDGGTLCDVLEEGAPRAQVSKQKNIPVVLLFLAVGLFNVCAPHASWYLGYGWHYKNAEPSEASLAFGRISGFIAIIIALAMLIL